MGRPHRDDRRDAALACIEASWQRHGRGPTYRELAEAMGLRSVSGAVYHVRVLLAAGCVTSRSRTPRTLRVVEW